MHMILGFACFPLILAKRILWSHFGIICIIFAYFQYFNRQSKLVFLPLIAERILWTSKFYSDFDFEQCVSFVNSCVAGVISIHLQPWNKVHVNGPVLVLLVRSQISLHSRVPALQTDVSVTTNYVRLQRAYISFFVLDLCTNLQSELLIWLSRSIIDVILNSKVFCSTSCSLQPIDHIYEIWGNALGSQ